MGDTAVEAAPAIDLRKFRDVLGHYPTGVVVVTGTSPDGDPLGMVVGTFSSVSLDPPLVSFMPTAGSVTYAGLRESRSFCVNVLAHDQRNETRTLSQRDADKFDKVAWTMSSYGSPMIDGAVAYIHCTAAQEIEAGDHLIVLCDVQDVEVSRPVTPLLFFQGGYGGFSAAGMAAYVDSDLISAVRMAEVARPQLTKLAERFDCEAVALVQINDHDQTIGAAASAASVQFPERLGVRLPLIPPLGDIAIAWNDEHTDRWLARVFPPDPELLERHRERLAAVRTQGFSAQVVPADREDDYTQLVEALHEYALGQLTPARNRAVGGTIAASADFLLTEIPPGDATARVISIAVPVFDPTAGQRTNSGLVLRLSSLPESGRRTPLEEYAAALKEAAAEVSAALAGPNQRDLERYSTAGLRDQA